MVEQYNKFAVAGDNGTLYTPSEFNALFGEETLGENIADNGGIKTAYRSITPDIRYLSE